jgi:WD40 repeat protein
MSVYTQCVTILIVHKHKRIRNLFHAHTHTRIHITQVYNVVKLLQACRSPWQGKDTRVQCLRARAREAGGWELLVATSERELLEVEFKNLDSATDCTATLAVVGHSRGSVKGIAPHPKGAYAATVGVDNVIRLWDLAAKKCSYACAVNCTKEDSLTCVAWRGPDGDQLAVGTSTGLVIVYEADGGDKPSELTEECRIMRGGKPVSIGGSNTVGAGAGAGTGSGSGVISVRYNPDGSLLAVGAADKVIEVLDANDAYARRGVCKGHGGAVVGLDWAESGGWLQSWCDTGELKYWSMTALRPGATANAPSEYKLNARPFTLHAEPWQTMECPLAWAAIGTWGEEDGEGTAVVRACDKDKGWIASGGASGEIRLFSYPASDNAERYVYKAHAYPPVALAHVPQSSLLLSVGGEDLTMFQWRVR